MTAYRDFVDFLESDSIEGTGFAVVFDIDGTLADVARLREMFLSVQQGRQKDFRSFHRQALHAQPIAWVKDAALQVRQRGLSVVLVTGRSVRWRHETSWWLALNGIPSDALFMRERRDSRPDAEIKQSMLDRIRRQWTPIWAFDDNPDTIAVWKGADIPVTVVPGWTNQ